MKATYTANYLKIYFWQAISFIAGFLVFFIVIPKLTSSPAMYGIYSICMSITLFFIYADIGFMNAGYKYVSEKFAVNDLSGEIRILGFIGFVLFVFIFLFSLLTFVFAFNPHLLIKGLDSPGEIAVASKLLFILALFSPIVVLQRMCQISFGIRLEDYVYQRLAIISNLVRIASVFYFFKGTRYDIVGYFLFYQLIGLVSNVLFLLIIKKRYHYDFWLLARSFRFSPDIYQHTRKLAFGTFFSTLVFILYYELDLFAIGKFSGVQMAGFYAVGLSIMSFFRGMLGIIYGPFAARFNHFMGLNDMEGLKKFLYNVVILTLPLVVFPVISAVTLMRPMVFCWVGTNYALSVMVAQFLMLSFVYNFIVQPMGIILATQARVRAMAVISLVVVFIYWGGIFATFSSMGILAFAIFKFIALTVAAVLYFILFAKFLSFKPMELLGRIISPSAIPILFLVTVLTYASGFMPAQKSKIGLLAVIGTGAMTAAVALYLYYIFSAYFRTYVNGLFVKLFKARVREA